jgi:hypothetical protein
MISPGERPSSRLDPAAAGLYQRHVKGDNVGLDRMGSGLSNIRGAAMVWTVMRYTLFTMAAGLLFLSCTSGDDDECAVGTEGCSCTVGGACDPGLECRSNLCVNACTVGNDGCACFPDGSCASGLTCASNVCVGGDGSTAGTSGEGGAGGGAGGEDGSGGGTGGTSSLAGTGGADGTDGTGGTGGAGGTGGSGPPQLQSCTGSNDCEATEVCVYDVDGNGSCIPGSQQGCGGDLNCIKNMGFVSVNGIEGDICQNGGDCLVDDGHIVGICVDAAGDGSDHRCVAICQYVDDPTDFGCATHPELGVSDVCSRTNVRVFLAVAFGVQCVGDSIESLICTSPADAGGISSAFEWTLNCIEEAGGCNTYMGCFTDGVGSDPDATQSIGQFFDAVSASGTSYVYTESGGSGLGDSCSTDCDCGRCNYCEGGECRYGGEGPYGCYRGCS